MSELENSSPVGRLLEEISWEGNARPYREGGRGKENVLTVEALTPLDYLPRRHFLASALSAAHGADDARDLVVREIEDVVISMLPGDVVLGTSGVTVQPDTTMISPSTYVLLEAKRIRRSAFQADQLAREFVAVLQESRDRAPLLLLVMGSPPPVFVRGFAGRTVIADAIASRLPLVEARRDLKLSDRELIDRIPEVMAWVTWGEIREVVAQSRDQLEVGTDMAGTVRRLADAAIAAIDWHS